MPDPDLLKCSLNVNIIFRKKEEFLGTANNFQIFYGFYIYVIKIFLNMDSVFEFTLGSIIMK